MILKLSAAIIEQIKKLSNMKRLSLNDLTEDLRHYFIWSANALMPTNPQAADKFLKTHKTIIHKTAQRLLTQTDCRSTTIYRGIILREPATEIKPHAMMQYLSFSTDRKIAEHFANVNGFGSDFFDVSKQLGEHGYVIEYTPKIEEILFHYSLLDVLPYAELFNQIGVDGQREVNGLREQKEVMILQPEFPLSLNKYFKTEKETR